MRDIAELLSGLNAALVAPGRMVDLGDEAGHARITEGDATHLFCTNASPEPKTATLPDGDWEPVYGPEPDGGQLSLAAYGCAVLRGGDE